MTLFGFSWPSKKIENAAAIESAFLEGLSRGFELGVKYAGEIDRAALDNARNRAISETLERINGNTTTGH